MLLIIIFLYAGGNVYDFPDHLPFTGDKIHNPYEELPNDVYKANFHGHSKAWGGITHGTDTDEAFIDGYLDKGYDLACLSNYQKISQYHGTKVHEYVPVYEHGYSIKKAHYLAINAKKVSFWDFPLWQTPSHQQTMIGTLRKNAEMVAIAHPKFGGGRSREHISQITGYHFTEVLNHYRTSDELWDVALSSGRLSWIIANDDIHDLKDPEIFQRWNVIFSDNTDNILASMRLGKNYGVESFTTKSENTFKACKKIDENTYYWKFEKQADTVLFIGQGGIIKQKDIATDSVTYTFTPEDTYIRLVAKNAGQNIYLNPLVRYNGNSVIMASDMPVSIKLGYTILWKSMMIALALGMILLWWKIIRYKNKTIVT